MNIPFSLRKVTPFIYDGDGRFPKDRIKGRDKRYERKRQFKRYFKSFTAE